jgi:hypothetical protein
MPKDSVDGGLIPFAMPTKKTENVGVDTQRDLLLFPRPANRVFEEIATEFRDFR